MAQAATLEAKRRALIAAYAGARRRHATRAGIARRLTRITCDLLRAEIRALRTAEKQRARTDLPDLFGAAR